MGMREPGLQGYLEALTPPPAQNTLAALEGAQDSTRTQLGMLSGDTAPCSPCSQLPPCRVPQPHWGPSDA